MQTIVVGVDGSDGGMAALRFAVEEAAVRGAQLKVVCAWSVPASVYSVGMLPDPDLSGGFSEAAGGIAAAAIAEAKQLAPDVECIPVTPEAPPAQALVEESETATLVVVGNRGHGKLSSLLLGSVSQHVVHHARCPVVIIPHTIEAESAHE
jgi:nucleotide-binding universal stress UspA family protein